MKTKNKTWYEIHGAGPHTESTLLAKVKSPGTALIVANALADHYKDVKIK